MSNITRLVTDGQRNEEASRWIAKLDAGLSADDAQALREWMWEDVRNEKVLAGMATLWDKMDVLANLSDLFPHVPHRRTRRWRQLAIAAGIVLAAVAGVLNTVEVNQRDDPPVMANATYETRIGDQVNVTLADGSAIRMNTNTRVSVSMGEKRRLIFLERGEIHVEIVHDPDRPLSVVAGNRIVQAVGTAFNVKIDGNQHVEVLVTEGRVRVGIRPKGDSIPPILAGSSRLVSKGERVVLDDKVGEIIRLAPQEMAIELSWREGNLIFRGESLREATDEISRYAEVEFVFEDKDLEKVLIAGLFKTRDVEGFLASLEANFDIVYARKNERIILLSSASEEME